MFRRLEGVRVPVEICVNGQNVQASDGDSVAAALLVLGIATFRHTPKTGSPRAAYCGMGVCFDCLVTIDGEPNRQACLTPIAPGMTIDTGTRLPQLSETASI
ncbi:MAG: (2Fe-2S)-binding protein [Acetobacteraceae bacterium]|nr:(2Fe-2S)-binding protein [Acetobacteraceae bacterium]